VAAGKIAYFEGGRPAHPIADADTKDAIPPLFDDQAVHVVAAMMLVEEGGCAEPIRLEVSAQLANLQVSVPRSTRHRKQCTRWVPAERQMTIQTAAHTSGLVYGGFTSHAR